MIMNITINISKLFHWIINAICKYLIKKLIQEREKCK